MTLYLGGAVFLNFLVDLLLLAGINRVTGYPWGWTRCLLGAAVGCLYCGLCLVPELRFLGNTLWRGVFLALMGAAAYGFPPRSLGRILLTVLLGLTLGETAQGRISFWSLLAGFALAGGFGRGRGGQELVEVELCRDEKRLRLLALRDTGNTLTDPVTGQSVLVADAESAETLLGLSRAQLADPVGTLASGILPGLRLIPYRAVGVAGGMLLAIRLEKVRIGNRTGARLVAFAPTGLGENGTYRALTGGMA